MGYVVVILVVLVLLYLLYMNSEQIQQLNEDGQPVPKNVQGYANWLMAGAPGVGNALSAYGKQPWIWVILLAVAAYIFKKK